MTVIGFVQVIARQDFFLQVVDHAHMCAVANVNFPDYKRFFAHANPLKK
jgi:hypothetical protein